MLRSHGGSDIEHEPFALKVVPSGPEPQTFPTSGSSFCPSSSSRFQVRKGPFGHANMEPTHTHTHGTHITSHDTLSTCHLKAGLLGFVLRAASVSMPQGQDPHAGQGLAECEFRSAQGIPKQKIEEIGGFKPMVPIESNLRARSYINKCETTHAKH